MMEQWNGLAGLWRGIMRTWFEPEVLASSEAVLGEVVWVLNGRFLQLSYASQINGQSLHGRFLFGYNDTTQRYETTWIDDFHMGNAMMFCEGEPSEGGFWVLGSYAIGDEDGTRWGWRTELRRPSEHELILTAYNITPEGEEAKGVEWVLTQARG